MIGTLLSHYRIRERLGAGGMGVVYRAHDEHLDRDVAVKVLPEGALGDEAARRRFQREALAASRVSHPGVGVIYDFGREGRIDFLAMEFVPGESLESVATRAPLPEPELIAIGVALADALAALHGLGVIHCDLKPANVIRTPAGTVKLVDFGLSRLLRRADQTGSGTRAEPAGWTGTLGYMAPEQFTGARLDPRTDLYALGVLLYALAAGHTPHVADDPHALMYAVVHTPAPALPDGTPVSAGFAALLRRALEKDPERRFAGAVEMRDALRALRPGPRGEAGGPGEPERPRGLAVLPLANLAADPQQQFFADGMTEALIGDLTGIEALRVISRTSVMRYRGTTRSLPEIAHELGVDLVVEGSVLRAGGQVRITAQLVDGPRDRNLRAWTFERPLDDVLALQREVARAIAGEIRVRLSPRESTRLDTAPEVPSEAVDTYLLGRHLWNRRTEPEVRRALEFFRRAVQIAPRYARAHAGIADVFAILADMDVLSPPEARAGASAAAERALALDPDLPEANTSLGFIRTFFEWDWSGAETAYRRAIAAGPSYATGHQWYSELLALLGRCDEAEAEARRALALDPLGIIMHTTLADVLFFARRYGPSIEVLRRVLEFEPGFAPAITDLGRVLTEAGEHDEAIAMFRTARRIAGTVTRSAGGLAYALARAGRTDEARAALAELEAGLLPPPAAAGRHSIAVVRLALGDRDGALDWLERAHRDGDRALVWMRVHPRLDPLRGEPRFERLLEAMGLAG